MEIQINIQKLHGGELHSITILNKKEKIELRYKDSFHVEIIDLKAWTQKVADLEKIVLINDINHKF